MITLAVNLKRMVIFLKKIKLPIKLVILACLSIIFAFSLQIYTHYSLLSQSFAKGWQAPLAIKPLNYTDLTFADSSVATEIYVVHSSGLLEKLTLSETGTVSASQSLQIPNYNKDVFKKNVYLLDKQILHLLNQKVYLTTFDFSTHSIKQKVIADKASAVNLSKSNISSKLYSSFLLNDSTIKILELDTGKSFEYTSKHRIKTFNFDAENALYLQTVEHISPTRDMLYQIQLYPSFIKKEAYSISLFNNKNIYDIKGLMHQGLYYVVFNETTNEKGRISNQLNLLGFNKNLEQTQVFTSESLVSDGKLTDIGNTFKLTSDSKKLYLVFDAINLDAKIKLYTGAARLTFSNTLETFELDFLTNTLSHIQIIDFIANDTQWFYGKEIKGDGYNIILNTNHPHFLEANRISSRNIEKSILNASVGLAYGLIFLVLNTIITLIYLLVPTLLLLLIFKLFHIENSNIKSVFFFLAFALVYLKMFNDVFFTSDVMKYAPHFLSSLSAKYYMPFVILGITLFIQKTFNKKSYLDYPYNLIFNIIYCTFISCLIYIPFNYIYLVVKY